MPDAEKKLLAVVGATGNQGGSVIDVVLQDSEISQQFSIRGLTRDSSKPAAKALAGKGVEVVNADVDDGESLKTAFRGVHTVFAMTSTIYDQENGEAKEIQQGRTIADAAVSAGVSYLIYSSIPSGRVESGGKLTNIFHFEAKYQVEQYLRSLSKAGKLKSSFFAPGSFMQNYAGSFGVKPLGDGTYALFGTAKDNTPWPLIDIVADTGKWVAAVLAEPDKYEGKVFCAATRLYTTQEICDALSKSTGKVVKPVEIPEEKFVEFLPPPMRSAYAEMFALVRDYGYYGPDMEAKVKWSAEQARGKLTTFEEYLERCPLKLE